MDYLTENVAVNLKRIRQSKGMSLDQVSEQTGVSKSMLSQIEKGTANPSLGVLGKITSGLRIEFQELIATPLVDSYLVTPEDLVPTKELEGQYTVWTCFPYEDTRLVEIYRIDIEPGGTYVSGGHGEKTREYLVVTDGVMTVECNGKEHEIHICRIQPSAKAGLHDQVFHAGFFENQHSHQEQRLKIARMAFALRLVFFGCFFHFEKCVKKLLIRHIFPVDLEPLVDAYKVRGGKKSCLFAACKQHRIQVRADASLSVRARHMDNFDPFLRIPKARKKLPRMFRRMLHRKFRYCFDIINCFCIIHLISPFFSILGLLSDPSTSFRK